MLILGVGPWLVLGDNPSALSLTLDPLPRPLVYGSLLSWSLGTARVGSRGAVCPGICPSHFSPLEAADDQSIFLSLGS